MTKRQRVAPTDDWHQLRLYVGFPEQETYALLRPIVLFGQTACAGWPITIMRAETWAELRAAHDRFFADYNLQSHHAHRKRRDGSHSPLPFPAVLLPHAPGLLLEDVYHTDQTLIVVLRSTAPTALCPVCQQLSARIHSHYERQPTDLPWGGTPLRLLLRVRKFFCGTPSCPRRIFTERLPGVIAPSARATDWLTALLHAIAFALGGEAGARLARQVGVPVSPATLINLIRRAPLPVHSSPQILGVDDWAQRKGIRYGTALVDLERHRLIDLLPDRTAETLAQWLAPHDGIAIIARDRRMRCKSRIAGIFRPTGTKQSSASSIATAVSSSKLPSRNPSRRSNRR